MRIWIDADTAPKAARKIVDRAAQRLGLDAALITTGPAVRNGESFDVIHASEADGGSAGFIVAHAEPGDLVVTHALTLTERLLPDGVCVLDVRGTELTGEEVGEHPSLRSYLESLRAPGANAHGPPPFDESAKREFAAGLDRLLTRMTRDGPA